jgi:hypothetical protein
MEKGWCVAASQSVTMRPAKLHPDTKVRRESSRRVRGLEYLRDHDEELSALYYKQSDCTLLWYRPLEEFEEQAGRKHSLTTTGATVRFFPLSGEKALRRAWRARDLDYRRSVDGEHAVCLSTTQS